MKYSARETNRIIYELSKQVGVSGLCALDYLRFESAIRIFSKIRHFGRERIFAVK